MRSNKNTSRVGKVLGASQSAMHYLPFVPKLNSFRTQFSHAFHDGWDGYGAAAINSTVMVSLERYIAKFASERFLEEVSAGSDGSLSAVWDDDKGNYVFLGVGPGKTIHLYYNLADGTKWEGVTLTSDARLDAHLRRAFSFIKPAAPEDNSFSDNHAGNYTERFAGRMYASCR